MTNNRGYLIVTTAGCHVAGRRTSGHARHKRALHGPTINGYAVRRHRRSGRHRLGVRGTVHRPRSAALASGHHHRVRTGPASSLRYASLVGLLSTVAVSTWFAATGAAAFAQMLQP